MQKRLLRQVSEWIPDVGTLHERRTNVTRISWWKGARIPGVKINTKLTVPLSLPPRSYKNIRKTVHASVRIKLYGNWISSGRKLPRVRYLKQRYYLKVRQKAEYVYHRSRIEFIVKKKVKYFYNYFFQDMISAFIIMHHLIAYLDVHTYKIHSIFSYLH